MSPPLDAVDEARDEIRVEIGVDRVRGARDHSIGLIAASWARRPRTRIEQCLAIDEEVEENEHRHGELDDAHERPLRPSPRGRACWPRRSARTSRSTLTPTRSNHSTTAPHAGRPGQRVANRRRRVVAAQSFRRCRRFQREVVHDEQPRHDDQEENQAGRQSSRQTVDSEHARTIHVCTGQAMTASATPHASAGRNGRSRINAQRDQGERQERERR